MSVLERLLANAALRDEAGRLRGPEPQARPPSGVSRGVGGGAASSVPQPAPPVFPGPRGGEGREAFLRRARQKGFPWGGRAWELTGAGRAVLVLEPCFAQVGGNLSLDLL